MNGSSYFDQAIIQFLYHSPVTIHNLFPVAIVIFLAVFTQSLTGFGLGLVSMPLLTPLLGIEQSGPLVSLVGLTAELLLLVRHRHAFQFHATWRLAMASALAIPVGIMAVRMVDQQLVLHGLGVLITSYALLALLNLRLPRLEATGWAYAFGFMSGLLGGAYNASGPPSIIYGNCRGWRPAEFKANLQGLFLFNTILVSSNHILGGHFTPTLWHHYWSALPAIALGLFAGSFLDKWISPHRFRQLVLLLLVGVGLRLLIQ